MMSHLQYVSFHCMTVWIKQVQKLCWGNAELTNQICELKIKIFKPKSGSSVYLCMARCRTEKNNKEKEEVYLMRSSCSPETLINSVKYNKIIYHIFTFINTNTNMLLAELWPKSKFWSYMTNGHTFQEIKAYEDTHLCASFRLCFRITSQCQAKVKREINFFHMCTKAVSTIFHLRSSPLLF